MYMQFYDILSCICISSLVDVFDQTHPDINQTFYMDACKNTVKLHVHVFLRLNTWLFKTC